MLINFEVQLKESNFVIHLIQKYSKIKLKLDTYYTF